MSHRRLEKSLLKKKILSILRGQKLISLATLADKKPWVRLVVSHNNGLKLYVASYASSRKIKEIKRNPAVHAVVAKDLSSMKTSYVQIAGRATVKTDKATRQKWWYPYMHKYYRGIDDPEYVVIEITPDYIEYWRSEFTHPEIYKP